LNRLSRAHERYRRQTTDGRAITYSEREREFTLTKSVFKLNAATVAAVLRVMNDGGKSAATARCDILHLIGVNVI